MAAASAKVTGKTLYYNICSQPLEREPILLPVKTSGHGRSLLQNSALDRLVPVLVLIALLWVAVGWAIDQW